MVNSSGRSSGSWFALLPAPSHPVGQWSSQVSSPFTAAGPRVNCTLFPYPKVTMVGTLGEADKTCQVH